MRRLVILLLCLATPAAAQQQQHPNLEQGVAPNKLYQFGNLDTVNLFSGNLMVHLPIGPSYPVGPGFGYQLTLSGNSKVWDYEPYPVYDWATGLTTVYTAAYPDRRSNAGLGWSLSLGRFIPVGDPNGDGVKLIYEDPTAKQYLFSTSLHDEVLANRYDCDTPGALCDIAGLKRVLYTRDGTNLRLKVYTNGTYELAFPNGERHYFDTGGRLTAAIDAFNNSYNIAYTLTDGLVDSWTLTDSHNRQQKVIFKTWTHGLKNYKRVIDKIELTAFPQAGNATPVATYLFDYGIVNQNENDNVTRGCGHDTPGLPSPTPVPLLKSITLPDDSKYIFAYHMASTPCETQCIVGGNCEQGSIASIKLPTGGTRKFAYQQYEVPLPTCDKPYFGNTPGIKTKSDFKDGATNAWSTWTYQVSINSTDSYLKCDAQNPTDLAYAEQEMQVAVISPEGHKSIHYFSIWPVDYETSSGGFEFKNYGYPFTSFDTKKSGSRNLSVEEYQKGCPTCAHVLKRSAYVLYEGIGTPLPDSPRVVGRRTVFDDDGGKYVDVDLSDYDGYGHLRKEVTSSDFAGTTSRTVVTRYNPSSTANGRASGSNSLLIGPASDWILNKYDRMTTEQGTVNSVADSCFDSSGFLLGRRTYKEQGTVESGTIVPTSSVNDVVTIFGKTAAINLGFVADESWFGGDRVALPSTYSNLCTTPSSTADYRINYTYASGALATSQYQGMTWKTTDLDIDPRTGLPSKSRDASGVETTLTYDTSGRLKTVVPSGRAWTDYTYSNVDGTTPASFVAKQCPKGVATCTTPLTDSRTWFDDFGRVLLSKTRMPDSGTTEQWSTVKTEYDALGRAIATSMPQFATNGNYDAAFTPTYKTSSTYDAFDRPLTITAADNKQTTLSYLGARSVERTAQVATSTTAESGATTTELYDGFGRLATVNEPGSNSTTTYSYDIGSRLSGVSMVTGIGTETRSFTYDRRGFLQQETHPELGASGNGSVTYDTYDARGHAGRKLVGPASSSFDLKFENDAAERLTKLHQILNRSTGTTQLLKQFDYATQNDTTASPVNRRAGKLETATRYNYPAALSGLPTPPAGQFVVTETLRYQHDAGLLSSRDTKVEHKNGPATTLMQELTQSYSYNDLSQVTSLTYPSCVPASNCTGGSPIVALPGAFTYGRLTSIAGYGSSIKYHPSGMVNELVHGQNGGVDVKDTITAESGMPRPASIDFTGWEDCVLPSVAIDGLNAVCASSTANTASVTPVTGATYLWEITNGNGTITFGSTSSSMTYSAGASGTVALRVTVGVSCGSTAATKDVAITPPPAAGSISGLSPVCASSAGNTASVTPVTGATYLWEITNGNGTITLGSTSSSMTYTAGASGTVALRVTVSGSCGSSASTRDVAITQPPSAAITSGNQTIAPGQSTTIQVALTGTPPWRITWSDGVVQDNLASSPASRTVSPTVTTTYSISAVSDAVCAGSPAGSAVTITVATPPPAPAGLMATTVTGSTKQVIVRWNVVSQATSYLVERSGSRNGPWSTIACTPQQSGGVMSCTDSFGQAIPIPEAYVYQVRSVASGLQSGPSNMDYATVGDLLFTDDPLATTGSRIYGRHVSELRLAIDKVRVAAGLNVRWSNYNLQAGPVLALHFYDGSKYNDLPNATDLRNVLDEAVLLIRGGRLSYTPPPPGAGGRVFGYQVQEIREGVK